ncbi:GMC family oxidoreductase [Pseudomonas fluorescens]|uniref:GMC family oxidoreductase n=1 Tax=Pseudomonas fluorescens TaxID=294 RepID=UPI003F9875B0
MAKVRLNSKVVDVLIVGAGASGAVAARHLAEAGMSVICLEQGPKVDNGEFAGDKPEWELMSQKRWHPNPNVRDLESDYPIETSESDVNPLMYNAQGGSTLLWAAHWQRFKPSDFRVKTLDGVADDWPFTYEELAPFYEQMEVEMGVSGMAGDPAYPPKSTSFPMPALPIGKIGMKAASGMNKLGWHWWPGTNAIPSKAYEGRNPCVRRGTCITGCPERSKASTDHTHLPSAIRNGAEIISGARVRQVTVNEQGLATGAIYVDRNGREFEQRAHVVIVCCNAVGTPRLLLNSKSDRFPDGLANSSGLLGRNLMMHPYAAVSGSFDEPLESWLGPAGQSIYSMEFYETDTRRDFVRGAKWQVMPSGGPLGLRAAYGGKPLEESWGANLHRNTARTFGRSFEWGITAEDLPDENNRIILDSRLTDSDGVPAPKILYRNSENTKLMLDFHLKRAHEAMDAAGAVSMTETSLMRDCGWHLMGTARMGNDPATSVVDQWGRSHDVPNLFILDGSIFVTSGAANPTATITAIALRAVKHLVSEARNQKVAV